MPKISQIAIDQAISKGDKFLGSDASGGTRNYRVEDISKFIKDTNAAGAVGQYPYIYYNSAFGGNSSRPSGSITIDTNDDTFAFSDVTTIKFSNKAFGSDNAIDEALLALDGKTVAISSNSNQNNFGIYTCTGVTQDPVETNFYNVSLTAVSTNGSLTDGEFHSVLNSVSVKPEVGDGGLTEKNFTTALKDKLDGIEEGAEVNVQPDWNATSGDALILNKPNIPTDNSELTNGAGYITDGNTNWNNTYGFITGLDWTELGGSQSSINLSGFNNDSGFITSYTETDTLDSVTSRGNTTTNAIAIEAATDGFESIKMQNFADTYSNRISFYKSNGTSRTVTLGDNGASVAYPFMSGMLANYGFVGNQNSGFHIFAGSNVAQTFHTNGNVGIGTTTNAGYKLDVNGTGRIGDSSYYLTLTNGGANGGVLRVGGASYGYAELKSYSLRLNGGHSIAGTGGTAGFTITSNVAPVSTDDDDYDGAIVFRAGNAGTNSGNTWSGYSNAKAFNFIKKNLDSTYTSLMVLHGNNNVGIGVVNPSYKLQVDGTVSAQLTNATHADQVYYDSATGELTYGAAAGGSTPTLDEVTTAGNITTNHINVGTLGINTNPIGSDSFAGNSVFSILAPAGSRERLIYAKVADSDSYFSVFNTTSYSGQFLPMFAGYHPAGQDRTGMLFHAAVPDINTKPALSFRASVNNYDTAIVTRPLFSFGGGIGGNTSKMMIWGDGTVAMGDNVGGVEINNTKPQVKLYVEGNVGIGTTTDAGYKLDVNGTARITSELIVQDIYIGKGGDDEETNTAVGYNALANNTVPYFGAGFRNTAFGYNALFSNTTGSRNTSVGRGAGESNTTGASNVFLGESSGQQNIIGSSNVYIGHGAGGVQDSSGNTYVGTSAGYSAAQGTGNSVYIGLLAGHATTGGDNVFLGNNAGFGSTKSDWLIIGNRNNPSLIEGNFATGNVMIGTSTDAGYKLDVNGSFRATTLYGDGSNLTGITFTETDTLDSVTTRGNTTNNTIQVGKINAGDSITVSNSERALNLVSSDAVMRILRVSSNINTAAPAVELIHRTTPDGVDTAYWDFYISSTGFLIRNRANSNTNVLMASSANNVLIGTTTDAGYKLDVNGDTRVSGTSTLPTISDGVYLNAGSSNWKKEKFVRSLGITGAATANSWVRLARVVNNGQWKAAAIKLKISGFRRDGDGTECIDGKYENDNSFPSSHEINWYSTDDFSNLISEVRSVRTYAVTTNNIYDIYVKIANGYMNDFTVEAEYWTSTTDSTTEVSFPTDTASTTTPTSNYGQIILTERNWKTNNDFITSNGFVKKGGSSSEFLKADGSVDSSSYLTSYTETDTLATVTARGATTTTQMSVGSLVNSVGSFNSRLDLSGEGGFHSSKFTFNNQGRFIAGQVNVKGSNDIFFQAAPYNSSGYGFLETWSGAGMVIGTGGNANPVIFQINRAEKMRLATSTGNVLIGTTTDSGYKLDVSGVTFTQGLISRGTGANSTVIGLNASVNGTDGVAIGDGAECWYNLGSNAVAIGVNSNAGLGNSTAVGGNAVAAGGGSVAIGANTDTGDNGGIAVGLSATTGSYGMAIGYTAVGSAQNSIAIGRVAQATVDGAIAIGQNANATNTQAISIGRNQFVAKTMGTRSIAIGLDKDIQVASDNIIIGYMAKDSATNLNARNVIIGHETLTHDGDTYDSVFVGYGAKGRSYAHGRQTVAVGRSANTWDYSVAVGYSAGTNSYGVAVGYDADAKADSVSLGAQAIASAYTTSIGRSAGSGASGQDNVFLGYGAGSSNTNSDWFILKNRNYSSLIEGNFATGDVMIGTSTDSGYKLDVNGTTRINGTLNITNSNAIQLGPTFDDNTSYYIDCGNQLFIRANQNAADTYFTFLSLQSGTGSELAELAIVGSATNNRVQFKTQNTERMRVESTGNVLIGTTTDSGYKLDVNGTANANGFSTGGQAGVTQVLEIKGPWAMAIVNADGSLQAADNLTCVKSGTGTYDFSFSTPAPNSEYVITATFSGPTGNVQDWTAIISARDANGFTITTTYEDNGTAPDSLVDLSFDVVVNGLFPKNTLDIQGGIIVGIS